MIPGLTSIIIPTRNRPELLREAVASALAQTADVEVLVVVDGPEADAHASTGTAMSRWLVNPGTNSLRVIELPHQSGPSAARNRGIDEAIGEFVMFLDDDDVIAPTKIAEQIAAFDDAVGWVICDVEIDDVARGRRELASHRYRYADRQIGGWIREQLAAANFIPIMAPLVRRALLTEDVRFGDLAPEDWHFWYRLAAHARVRYLPRVLATYRKRRSGRHALGLPQSSPSDGPIVLNLGCGTPGAASWHPMPGCVNLDRSLGWCFEDGLGQYADGSVDAITISHALMYVEPRDFPRVLGECFRVLVSGGVLRVTEDDAINPLSSRCGGWKGSEPAVTVLDAQIMRVALESVGFSVYDVDAVTTRYRTPVLLQAQHGAPPDVFFLEGVKR